LDCEDIVGERALVIKSAVKTKCNLLLCLAMMVIEGRRREKEERKKREKANYKSSFWNLVEFCAAQGHTNLLQTLQILLTFI
jgi:hypothetical protein